MNHQAEEVRPGLKFGVYSYAEAAALLRVAPARVRRWADGYTFQRKYGVGQSRPILQTSRRIPVLSFPELIELFFVKEYVDLDVPLPAIRTTAERLSKELGPFPFSKAKLLVVGRELLRPVVGGVERADIGQMVCDWAEGFYRSLTFVDGELTVYRPEQYGGRVALELDVQAGAPTVSPFCVPTRAIYSLWRQEHDLEAVGRWFDIEIEDVSAAVRFEGDCRQAT